MATAFIEQQKTDTRGLDFDERFSLLVDAEWMFRQNKRVQRRLKEAKLKLSQACVEDVDGSAARGIEKSMVLKLASCSFVEEHRNVLVTGMTGTGKSYLACALGQQACRKGYRVLYRRAGRLYDELAHAKADGSLGRMLARIAKVDVLVIDDFGLGAMREGDRHALLEVLEDRYGSRSTIITSQLPPDAWHDYIHDPTVADSICDRVIHNAHRVALKGPSRRKEKTEKN
jgi:DNA replication protein DnaC